MILKVGWMRVKIKYTKELIVDGARVYGTFDSKRYLIEIDPTAPKELRRVTLIHEIVHCILFVFGRVEDCNNENLVDCLANALYTVQKENGRSLYGNIK